ncbi:MAG: trimethylamine methyltransferase family protein, partial [Candidatus Ratteibacteria bacterium]
MDTNPNISQIYQQFISLKYIKNVVLCAYSIKTFDIIYEMSKVCENKISTGVHPISPLKAGGEEFELAIYLIEKGIQKDFGVAPMPVFGITAPCHWISAWAQSFAESIGTSIILENLGADNAYPYGTLYVADMKTGNFIYGSPEAILITIFEKRINEAILGNLPRVAKSLNTSSKNPDIHAGLEKSIHTFVSLTSGYKKIIYVSSPPTFNGKIHPLIVAVCDYLGIKNIFKVGGVCAISGFAFGTETIPKVDL